MSLHVATTGVQLAKGRAKSWRPMGANAVRDTGRIKKLKDCYEYEPE